MYNPYVSGVKHYKESNAYLVVIPSYYFGSNVSSWYETEVGKYYVEVLSKSSENIVGIYIYHTQDGDNVYKIHEIFTLMSQFNQEYFNEILTFTQCFTCNRIASVFSNFHNFNSIIMFNNTSTQYCNNCFNVNKKE